LNEYINTPDEAAAKAKARGYLKEKPCKHLENIVKKTLLVKNA
jgi:hypothetical protein